MSMSDEQITYALGQLRERIDELGNPENKDVAHLHYMLDTIPVLLRQDRREKVMRWLGFIQGALWGFEWSTIAEMKTQNKGRPFTLDDIDVGTCLITTSEFADGESPDRVYRVMFSNDTGFFIEHEWQRYPVTSPGLLLVDE